MVVCGKAVLFGVGVGVGVGVRPKAKATHSVFFVSCSSDSDENTSTTTNYRKKASSSSFGRLKAQQVKALIHRTKNNTRRKEEEEEEKTPRRASSSNSKGWGDRVSSQSSSLPLADTNFFSLKSFKEIGCTDYIIQSLHNLSLTRPSHIQVLKFHSHFIYSLI